ncbi:thiamine-phosphate pyrophosphorylase [Bacillus ectoiniformans]|uniref:thiamine phosphate synthase n=1 Tax=Bacillus ectoiniformans TaxID=1494429 RepID=UPI001956FA9E|nr:thiamine phosphate synthase [Bacillus ectoiniformans]MBM7647372.1 thiamine-phosphate pyrophosphorylase [Bacillus ectoiniformans]
MTISKTIQERLSLYFIMGSINSKKQPVDVLKEAIDGGITLFQFREKGAGALTGREKYLLAERLQRVCQTQDIPFIVNDDVDLAVQLGADGVHIGQDDAPVDAVRNKIGRKWLGVSVHTLDEAQTAISLGADYLGIGPIFPTTTKQDAKSVQGTKLIQQIRNEGWTIPIVGIGGIHEDNAQEVIRAGADGVSVISAISLSESPKDSSKKLIKMVREAEIKNKD